jgi:hypothetical protein
MAGKPVADITSTDSGGKGSCNTPPLVLGKPSTGGGVVKVYAGKKLVVKNTDSFKPAPGTTPKGDPCQSTRTLKAVSTVKIGKQSIGKKGDVLNSSTNIIIAKASEARVFAT